MEKKNNGLMVVTIILGVLLIASIGYIIYSNQDNLKDNKTNNIENTTITEEEKEKAVKEIETKFKLDDYDEIRNFYSGSGNLWDYVSEIGKATKCNDSIRKELIEKGLLTKKDYTNTDYEGKDEYTYLSPCVEYLSCDEMKFYSKEEITNIYKKYFGKDKKFDLTNYPYYLEKNDVAFNYECYGAADSIDKITKIDSSMPTKNTVILTYLTKITEDDKTTEGKFSLTFKKEGSNWVYSDHKKIQN